MDEGPHETCSHIRQQTVSASEDKLRLKKKGKVELVTVPL